MQHLVNKQYKYNNDDFPGEKEVLNSLCSVTDCSLVMVNLSLKASGLQIPCRSVHKLKIYILLFARLWQ